MYDPVRHRYFQISQRAFSILSLWRAQPVDVFATYASERLASAVSVNEVRDLAEFIVASNLAVEGPGGHAAAFAAQERASRQSLVWRVIHNYLFFRVPLARPDRFLSSTMAIVEPLYSRFVAIAILMISLLGVYFASRQWERFTDTFLDFLSFDGFIAYGSMLVIIKTLHELGHAYTATRFGVRVNTMGVALIVLVPVLYTDVTDAWRLTRRRQKLAVDAAGIVVELSLAGLGLFAWSFLPDGSLRSIAFTAATVSLVMGLAINLNPLMRFDGYHLLADGWGIPNLQARSYALAVWRLREVLFAIGDPSPEVTARREAVFLPLYAVTVFIYRQVLFLGIALTVYHMFFKALGVVLFCVEIAWFVALPVLMEVRNWWHMKERILASRRSWISGTFAVFCVLLFIIPWTGSVTFQAVAYADEEFAIFPSRAAQIAQVRMRDGQQVSKGQPLALLTSPELDRALRKARLELALTELRLQRIAGDPRDLAQRIVLQGELARNREALDGLEKEEARLVVAAPVTGVLRDVDVDLRVGEWIDAASPIARVISRGGLVARGYLDEDYLFRIAVGAHAIFIPEDPLLPSRSGNVLTIAQTGSHVIEWVHLSSVYGGRIPSTRAPDGEIQPRSGEHLVRVQLNGPEVSQVVRGTLHIDGERESFAARVWRQILRVLVREAGA